MLKVSSIESGSITAGPMTSTISMENHDIAFVSREELGSNQEISTLTDKPHPPVEWKLSGAKTGVPGEGGLNRFAS
jgi:hypothetical protein